jgi:hypothetical protein
MSIAYQFTFAPHVVLDEAESTLHLTLFAVEGLIGRARVRLDAQYTIDESARTVVVYGDSFVSRLVARVFAGFILRECGEDAFTVEPISFDQSVQEISA